MKFTSLVVAAAWLAKDVAAQGCDLCPGGSLANPDAALTLTTGVTATCSEWLSTASSIDEAACEFLSPFYGSICGCSSTPTFSSSCELCGDASLEFADLGKGLTIPSSTSSPQVQITCGAIFEGAQAGAVDPSNCDVLKPIAGECGGCVAAAATSPPVDPPTPAPTIETFVAEAAPAPAADVPPPTMQEFVQESNSYVCDLCPSVDGVPGVLSDPSAKVTLISGEEIACGALLWGSRNGNINMDQLGCDFLQPFFGATCGCSTFQMPAEGGCNLCSDETQVFQDSFLQLMIPGSANTQITCAGIHDGALAGAVSATDCGVLSGISEVCGGCGSAATATNAEPEDTSKCIDCLDDDDSVVYLYKDFGKSGVTFYEALTAPFETKSCPSKGSKGSKGSKSESSSSEDSYSSKGSKSGKGGEDDCHIAVYPELENCVLTPIASKTELLTVQAAVPPHKAAYTSVYKERMIYKEQAMECYGGVEVEGADTMGVATTCEVEDWKDGLVFGKDYDKTVAMTGRRQLQESHSCPALAMDWKNYNTEVAVPSCAWGEGQPSYCGSGPVQNVGAVYAVMEDNYFDLRDVSPNWQLPGAVYKCCKDLIGCFEPMPTPNPSPEPSIIPSDQPSMIPSDQPSMIPSDEPSTMPSDEPSMMPSDQPSMMPSDQPSMAPSDMPSNACNFVLSITCKDTERDTECDMLPLFPEPPLGAAEACFVDVVYTIEIINIGEMDINDVEIEIVYVNASPIDDASKGGLTIPGLRSIERETRQIYDLCQDEVDATLTVTVTGTRADGASCMTTAMDVTKLPPDS